MNRAWCFAALFTLGSIASHAQSASAGGDAHASSGPTTDIGDYFSASFLTEHVPQLLERARASKDGLASLLLKRYPGNYMNLMVRTQTGVGEMHANWSDVLIALDGEADVITGGTLVDRTDGSDGESRGTRSEGGVHHVMHKGDVIHIAPSTPHWTVLSPGVTFIFFAVKIANPLTESQSTTPAPASPSRQ